MTYLELCQRALTECGLAASQAAKIALPTVQTGVGSLGRVVNWIQDSWNELQMERDDWEWMRSSSLLGGGFSFTTVAGQSSYPLGNGPGAIGVGVDAFGKWDDCSLRCYQTAGGFEGEGFMDAIGFDDWRNSFMFSAERLTLSRPVSIAIGPDQSLNLAPRPDAGYTVTGDYYTAPQVMSLDTDVPVGLPSRFHMLIVYRTMVKAAGYDSAPELFARGNAESARLYNQLLSARGQMVGFSGALA